MALYEMKDEKFEQVKQTTFVKEGIKEVSGLQKLLKDQIEILSSEILIISDEYSGWSGSSRRVDLLGIDKNRNLVVIELKRIKNNSYMDLQALRYAAMVSTLSINNIINIYEEYCEKNKKDLNPKNKLADHLNCDVDELQQIKIPDKVKIYLVNEDFTNRELTSTVLWLIDSYDLDITCIQMNPYKHNNKTYVDVQQLIPMKEADEYRIQMREKKEIEKSHNKKDYSQYLFEGVKYGKSKLVLAVIKKYVTEHPNISLKQLEKIFPQKYKGKSFYVEANKVEKTEIRRYYDYKHEIINLEDCKIAVSNQWSLTTIEKFLKFAKEQYPITKL